MSDTPTTPTMYPCPDCDREFPSKQALNGHRMIHVKVDACPECGRDNFTTPNALGRHRNLEHGVVPAYKQQQQQQKAATPARVGSNGGRIGRPPVNRPSTGWNVDHFFQSVVRTLWPSGQVPIKALVPLMDWREATREMMEKVQGE